MRQDNTRRRVVAAAVVPVGLVVSSALVLGDSFAAFTATTSTGGNTFAAGEVELTNSAVSTPFSTGPLAPGDSDLRCITVTYTGNVPATSVVLHVTGYAPANAGPDTAHDLEDDLQITVAYATGDQSADCSTFTPEITFATEPAAALGARSTPSAGLPTRAGVVPGDVLTYRVAYAFTDLGVDGSGVSRNAEAMNDAVDFDLTWTTESTGPPL